MISSSPPPPPLIVIVGPTAVGKSRLALELARRAPAVLISADALQVYRGFDAGTGNRYWSHERRSHPVSPLQKGSRR